MAGKFDTIIESFTRRYNSNSFIMGDRVKFVDSLDSNEWFRKQPTVKAERIKELVESGLNIRVSAVKSMRPAVADSGNFEAVDDFYYDIVREEAPGLYTQTFTVPEGVLELIDDYPNLAGKTPDKLMKKDPSQIKPGEVDVDGHDLGPVKQTASREGDRQLKNTNVDIAAGPDAKDGQSYTAKYLEG